jgi:hypothetical protein
VSASTPSITFVCCVEAGPLEPMTLRLVQSIRAHAGRMGQAPVLVINPRVGPSIARATRDTLERLGARYVHRPSRGRYAWYHFMNKVSAVELAERELAQTELISFLDCDVVALAEPTEFLLDESHDIGSCAPDNSLTASTTGPTHPREPYWRRMCDVLDMHVDDLPWVQAQDGVRVRFYLGAGIFAYRRASGFSAVYRETVTRLLDANVGIDRNGEHWLEQASFGLAIVRGGLRWKTLPPSHNCHLSSAKEKSYDPLRLREARLLHYHDAMNPHFWGEFLERIRSERPEHYAWLKDAGPIKYSSPLVTRVAGEALRIMRGVRRSAYRRRYRALNIGTASSPLPGVPPVLAQQVSS